ncbi:MAG TPA: coenzyme F420-0:L-glutamate ligase [Baekduia sp.]|nr:coenzyme F420-0:L-glutamate ligase [Baekduia sp.]
MTVTSVALPGLPEVAPGDNLAELIAATGFEFAPGDVLCVAHKVVSKSEGRIVSLQDVDPSDRASTLAASHGKDPRHVQVVLDEAAEIVRERPGVLICRTRHGFVCANAGVDASNAGATDRLILLPLDPDGSARWLRAALHEITGVAPAIVITDSFGRAWRHGQVEIAIGVAGLTLIDDWDGRFDSDGRPLKATSIAVADEAAAAADLVRSKDSREPAVVLRGLGHRVEEQDGPGIATLIRSAAEDLFS